MKKVLFAGALVLLVGVASALTISSLQAATGGGSHRIVRSTGSFTFQPNARVASNLRFVPGSIQIRSGGTLTFENGDGTGDPHTLSIVDAADVPTSLDDALNCGSPDTVCDAIFQGLGDNPATFTEGSGTEPGIDGRLDTLWINPGESASAKVTAPAGTTLYFICAIHAWMQGTIIVTN